MTDSIKRLRKQKGRLAYRIKRQAAQINNLVVALKTKLHSIEKAPRNGEWILGFDIDTGQPFVVRFSVDNNNWEAMIGGWFEESELRGWMALPDSPRIVQPYRKLLADSTVDPADIIAQRDAEIARLREDEERLEGMIKHHLVCERTFSGWYRVSKLHEDGFAVERTNDPSSRKAIDAAIKAAGEKGE